jgi:hypothetical protein
MEQNKKEYNIIEEVIWNDCQSLVNQWQPVDEVIEHHKKINPIIKSVGYILYEDDKTLIIGHSIDKEDIKVDGVSVDGGMIIYKPQIISRRIISNG